MLKHVLVGSLVLSSLAFARPQAVPVAVPVPQVGHRDDDRAGRRDGEARFDDRGRFDRDERDGRGRDELRAGQLLRAFDEAVARRDFRAVSFIDAQFSRLLDRELRRSHRDDQLARLSRRLDRNQGRMDFRSVGARRSVYASLVGRC